MTDEQRVRGRCPWCLESNFTDIPLKYEGAIAGHKDCAARFFEEMASTGDRDPILAMSVISFVAEHQDTDPTWGYQALRMLRGEDPAPPPDQPGG